MHIWHVWGVACWRTVALNAATRDSQSVRPGCLTLFCSRKSSNKLSDTLLRHSHAPCSPKFSDMGRGGRVSVARTKPIVCNAFSVCGLRTQECCVTPLNNNNNNITGDWRTCNLKVATPTQVSSCKNRISNMVLCIEFYILYNNLIFGLKHSKFDNQGVYLMLWTLIGCYFIRFL